LAAEAHKDEYRVTIRIPTDALASVLFDTGRILPVDEALHSGAGGGASALEQRRVNSDSGLHAQEESIVDRPVYGALAMGEDEQALGPKNTKGYGQCTITLKPSVAKERTVFTYGDSKHLDVSSRVRDGHEIHMILEDAQIAW